MASKTVNRRQLLTAGAWAAPAIAIAAAAPAGAVSVTLPEVTLVAHCTLTLLGSTTHGFTVTNTSATDHAVVAVAFTATAWGVTSTRSDLNIRSATSVGSASCPVVATSGATMAPETYQLIWGSVTTQQVSPVRWNSARSGTAIFTLPPNGVVRFSQVNINALGQPVVTASITTVNGEAPSTPQAAQFSFALGGLCTAS